MARQRKASFPEEATAPNADQPVVDNNALEIEQEQPKTAEVEVENVPESESAKSSAVQPSAPVNSAVEVEVVKKDVATSKIKALETETAVIGKQSYRLIEGKVYEVPSFVAGILQQAKLAVKL